MQEKWKERCIYCGGDVYYQSSRQLVKCEWCGHTLATAGFENELARMKAAVEEGEQAKRDLAAAEAAEQEARQRLNQVLSNFVEIGSSQKSEEELVQGIGASQKREEELIREIRDAFAEDSAVQSAMMDLLSAIRSEAGEGRNVIGEVLGSLMQGQQSADLRLAMLQELSGKMLHAQQDFGAQLSLQSEIYARLQAAGVDIQKSQQLLQQLMVWFQSASSEEQERLKQISSSSETLLRGQQEIAGKVDDLRAAADRTQKAIEDFQGQYTQDKLEEMRGLFHQAENFQLDREYDKAADYYRQVISKGGRDAEVCWRLLLCHYCITYRQNDAGESVPTILYPDLTAPDELSVRRELASALADCPHRQMYDVELRKIDTILDEYRLAQQEAAYDFDVFLSVKQEKDGHFTKDSDVASDLYDFLTSRGLKVFNSRRVVLPVGKSYEPYIISALLSAKAMIVVGSSADNMNAQWVKDEWSRFQWLQKREKKERGATDRRLLCYLTGSMRPEQIPRSLGTGRQAIVDGVRAHEQLSALLDELLVKKTSAGAAADYSGKAVAEDSYRKVLGQMTAWLYTGKYDKVLDRYDRLNESGKYLENAQLHLLALCAANHVEDVRKLAASEMDLSQERLFKLALKLSAGEEREELKSILDENQKHLRQAADGSRKDPGQGKKKEEKKSRSKWDELKNRPKKPAEPEKSTEEPEKSTEEPAKTEGKSGSKWTAVKAGEKSAPERTGETTGAKSVPERAGETTGAKSTSEKNEEKAGEKPKTEKTEETREAGKKPVKPAKEAAGQKKGPRTVDEPDEVPQTVDEPDEVPRTVDEPDEVPRTGNGGGTAGPGEDEPKQPFWIYGAIAAVVILICVLGLIFGPGRSSQSNKKAEDESGTAMEAETGAYAEQESAMETAAAVNGSAYDDLLVTPGKLTVGYSPYELPWELDDSSLGKPVGFDIDLAEALADRMGLELELMPFDWDAMLVNMDAGKFDIAISAISWTEERAKDYFLSTPYAIDTPMLFILIRESEESIKLNTIAIVDGTKAADWVDDLSAQLPTTYTEFPDAGSALEALISGAVDGVCINSATCYQYRAIAEEKGIAYGSIQLMDSSLDSKMCIGLSKDNNQLGEKVNEILNQLRRDGTLKEFAELWFGTDYPVDGALEANGIF